METRSLGIPDRWASQGTESIGHYGCGALKRWGVKAMGQRVLITDDDDAFRATLSEVLSRRGYSTCLASDGLEAVEVVAHGNIHLALFDIHMPRLDGLGALERVRESLPMLPCILMSAKIDDGILARAERLGANAVLPKPFSIADLVESIKKFLG